MAENNAVIGIYNSHTEAEAAVKALQRSGFDMQKLSIVVALLNHQRLPTGRFVPEPWPSAPERDSTLTVLHELPLAA